MERVSRTVTYADIVEQFRVDPSDRDNWPAPGLRLKSDGIWVKKPKQYEGLGLTPEEFATLVDHPTGDYSKPALKLPCTAEELAAFLRWVGCEDYIRSAQRDFVELLLPFLQNAELTAEYEATCIGPQPNGSPQGSEGSQLTEPPRTPEVQAEYDAAWWDGIMHAAVWWGLSKVTAPHAAMLLCGFNPNTHSPEDAERGTLYDLAGRQTGPGEYKLMRLVFCDIEEASPQSRTLAQWLAIAREKTLAYHSWIDTWLAATGKVAPSVQTPSPEATSKPSADPTDNVARHTLTKGKSVPLSAEVSRAKSLAIDSDAASSVWAELVKLAEIGVGSLIGHSSDGVQYRGAKYQATGEPDVFTQKNLRDRLKRAKAREGA
ncbi:hypothetical protein [Cupriavidus sp. AcVe19-1a]|uniref:hypothetical protein n=1 Tax=Cupriavidus sp. AcVe19-1a TaxID=2821359 RepID=UPI001AE409AA|nr:hypothetical protein [Cupriavidus sp. AcVe19-1a]MBP0629990.1 hypothetical protein [Cupriavidus sp. AcVe19-1a]